MGDVDDQEDTPLSVIIIVACVCGTIILVLLIVLIVLCYRRHNAQRKSNGTASPSGQPVITHPGDKPGDSQNGQPTVNGRGVENPGLDQIDLDDPSNTRVFSTDTSKVGPYGDIYAQPMKKQPNGTANGHAGGGHSNHHGNHHGNGQPPQWRPPAGPPPKYDGGLPPRSTSPENPYDHKATTSSENPYGHKATTSPENPYGHKATTSSENPYGHKAKRKNPEHQYLQLDDPYSRQTPHETSKEGSSDSGVSTPDPQNKPKKVIYEVIV